MPIVTWLGGVMVRVLTISVLAAGSILSGCASEAAPSPAQTVSYSDPQCFAVARDRAADAAANGWQADVQGRVMGDAYAACRQMKSASGQ